MTDENGDYKVGYKNPPLHARFKKGESRKGQKTRPRPTKNTVTLMDELFLSTVQVSADGERRKISVLHAIMMQLWKQELAGSRRARRTLELFEEFAQRFSKRQFRTIFVDNDYTTAMAAITPINDNNHD